MNVTEAAHLGSDLGAYHLGQVFHKGICGLSKDKARARFWLKKIVEGECKVKHMTDKGRAHAAELLQGLEQMLEQ